MECSAGKHLKLSDPDVDTLKCPKCKLSWRARGEYDYDLGGWHHGDDAYCPASCKTFFGFRVMGKVIDKHLHRII